MVDQLAQQPPQVRFKILNLVQRCTLFGHLRTPNGYCDMRRATSEVEQSLVDRLLVALASLGLKADREGSDSIVVNGERVSIRPSGSVGVHNVGDLIARSVGDGSPALVATERITEGARTLLREVGVGFFDARATCG